MSNFDRFKIIGLSQQQIDELTCGICQDIFNNPVVLSCCRQTFCNNCILEWLKDHNTCPNDRKPLDHYSLSPAPRFVFNILADLKVYCTYRKYGCPEEITKSEFERHVMYCTFNTCQSCDARVSYGSSHNCIDVMKARVVDLSKQSERTVAENRNLLQKNTELSEENTELKTKYESKCTELKAFDAQHKFLTEQNIGLKKKIETLRKEKNDNKSINSRLFFELDTSRKKLDNLKREIDNLKTELAVTQEENSYLKRGLDILVLENAKIQSDEGKLIKRIHKPFFIVFVIICTMLKFVRALGQLIFEAFVGLKDNIFRYPGILFSSSIQVRANRHRRKKKASSQAIFQQTLKSL